MSLQSERSPPTQHGRPAKRSSVSAGSAHASHLARLSHASAAPAHRLHRLVVNSPREAGELRASAAYSRILSHEGVIPIIGFAFTHTRSSNTESSSSTAKIAPK